MRPAVWSHSASGTCWLSRVCGQWAGGFTQCCRSTWAAPCCSTLSPVLCLLHNYLGAQLQRRAQSQAVRWPSSRATAALPARCSMRQACWAVSDCCWGEWQPVCPPTLLCMSPVQAPMTQGAHGPPEYTSQDKIWLRGLYLKAAQAARKRQRQLRASVSHSGNAAGSALWLCSAGQHQQSSWTGIVAEFSAYGSLGSVHALHHRMLRRYYNTYCDKAAQLAEHAIARERTPKKKNTTTTTTALLEQAVQYTCTVSGNPSGMTPALGTGHTLWLQVGPQAAPALRRHLAIAAFLQAGRKRSQKQKKVHRVNASRRLDGVAECIV